MLATLKSEFQLKNIGFRNCEPEQFYQSQWSKNRWIYFVIRLVFLVYWLSWFVASLMLYERIDDWWMKLTNWGVATMLLYYLVSFVTAMVGLFPGSQEETKRKDSCKMKTISGNKEAQASDPEENNNQSSNKTKTKQDLRWFHILVWMLFEVSCGLAFIVTASYWSLIQVKLTPFSYNNHLINSLLMILDLMINAVPVRLMHFYMLSLCGVAYTLFSFILYATGYESAIYPILDWADNFNFAIGLTLAIIFAIAPLLHILVIFSLYRFKIFISARVRCRRQNGDVTESSGQSNASLCFSSGSSTAQNQDSVKRKASECGLMV